MKYRKLSEDGDMTFGASSLNFLINTPETVAQAVKTRLLLWSGEWFLNVDEGTRWAQGVLGKKTKDQADSVIQNRILTTEGVTNIEKYASVVDPETRKFTVTALINTVYGVTEVEIASYADY